MAPRGTPILAVQDGRILRLADNSKGGITIYATDVEEQFVYYYAHLDRYYPNCHCTRVAQAPSSMSLLRISFRIILGVNIGIGDARGGAGMVRCGAP